MAYEQYLATTMAKGIGKIVPIVVSIVVGYFVFIKLPFFFFRRTLRDVRRDREMNDDNLPKFPEEPKVMKLEEKIKRDAEELKKEKSRFQQQQKEKPKEKKEEPKREEPKKEVPKKPAAESAPTPESVFELRPGDKFTPEQLKAKHRELIKQSHPDKVASMGPEFRKLAEKKTKEINEAYEKLKKKAS